MSHGPVHAIDAQLLDEARALERVKEHEYEGLTYLRFSDKHRHVPRGTVVMGGRVVAGYPSIGRIFMLEAGIRENFTGRFPRKRRWTATTCGWCGTPASCSP